MDVSNVSVQTIQAMQTVEQPTGITQQAQQGGQMDFLSLIMQLMGGTGEEGAKDLLAMLMEEGKKDTEEEGVNTALQMMMEMLASNPAMGSNLYTIDPQILSELYTAENAPALETLLEAEGIQGEVQGQEGLFAFLESQLPDTGSPEEPKNNIQAVFQPLQGMEQENPEEAIPMTVENRSSQTSDFFNQGANDFRSAVSQAKQELDFLSPNKDNKTQNRFDVDVDQLQEDVDSGRFVANSANVEEAPELPRIPLNIMSQVKEGIIQEIGSGKDEFIVKLKPEGLGEITVRLMQSDDKIALSISASNSHVARLLSSEIDQLRESLRPYNTVVQEVVDQQAYASNQDFAQNFSGQYQQQFAGQQQNQRRTQVSFRDFVNGDSPVEASPVPVGSHRISTGLNTYYV